MKQQHKWYHKKQQNNEDTKSFQQSKDENTSSLSSSNPNPHQKQKYWKSTNKKKNDEDIDQQINFNQKYSSPGNNKPTNTSIQDDSNYRKSKSIKYEKVEQRLNFYQNESNILEKGAQNNDQDDLKNKKKALLFAQRQKELGISTNDETQSNDSNHQIHYIIQKKNEVHSNQRGILFFEMQKNILLTPETMNWLSEINPKMFITEVKEIVDIKKKLPSLNQLEDFQRFYTFCSRLVEYGNQNEDLRIKFYEISQSQLFNESFKWIHQFINTNSCQPKDQLQKIINSQSIILNHILNFFEYKQYQIPCNYFQNSLIIFNAVHNTPLFLNEIAIKIKNILEEIQKQIQEEKQKLIYLRKQQKQTLIQKIPQLEEIQPDISDIQDIPSYNEIKQNLKYIERYSKVQVKGSYPSLEHYLTNNYYLLREETSIQIYFYKKDFFIEIKESLSNLMKQGTLNLVQSGPELQNLFYVYCNSTITNIQFDRYGIFFTIKANPLYIKNKKMYKWNEPNTKRLMNGSLLILTNSNFKQFFYLRVKQKDQKIDELFQKQGLVKFSAIFDFEYLETSNQQYEFIYQLSMLQKDNIIILETKHYWESYSHFLKCIRQKIEKQIQLPFVQTLVKGKKTYYYPSFVNSETSYKFDIDVSRGYIQKQYLSSINIANGSWQFLSKGSLDDSQFRCLKSILQNEISIIQGPPGTGKTYVGSAAVKVLLRNISAWNPNKKPILMVCKTNHALDQFLKHIEKFDTGIVRVGNRTQDPSLQKYTLNQLRDEFKQNGGRFQTPSIGDLKVISSQLQSLYGQLFDDLDSYTSQVNLSDYMDDLNFDIKNKLYSDSLEYFQIRPNQILDESRFQQEIEKSWWRNRINYEDFKDILCQNVSQKFKNKCNNWNKDMNSQKIQYQKEISQNQRLIHYDVKEIEEQFFLNKKLLKQTMNKDKSESVKQLLKEKNRNNGEDDDGDDDDDDDEEEEYIENKDNLFIDDRNIYSFLGKEKQEETIQIFKCDKQKLKKILNEVTVKNIMKLSYEKCQILQKYIIKQINTKLIEFKSSQDSFKEEQSQDDLKIIQGKKIVGMTLTGASMNAPLLKYLKAPIVIIEEAGEVLENLVIPLLSPSTKQLVLIGDHKQLKPQVNNYFLEQRYNMNTSLLERLINNQIGYEQLTFQRRMRPEFADYIRLIYDNYFDYSSVKSYPNVKGMPSNIYLINHNQLEDSVENTTTKKNSFEANYALKLTQYLLKYKQFKQEDITVLSMYLGQSQLIRQIFKNNGLHQVKISSVDNYQGEENEIIILSLVRSNRNLKLGYVDTANRVNVAFSRAKIGFYCLGNFSMIQQSQYLKSDLWKQIINLAEQKKHLVDKLYLKLCNKHTEEIRISHFNDFNQILNETCKKKCNTLMECGHNCPQRCHFDNCDDYYCYQQCKKAIYPCNHQCKLKCNEECKCTESVTKKLSCGHDLFCQCSFDTRSYQCLSVINITLDCSHQKSISCYQIFQQINCERIVDYICPGCKMNTFQKKCFEQPTNIDCTQLVEKKLPCGHIQKVSCNQSIFLVDCLSVVDHKLKCGHDMSVQCHQKNDYNKLNALTRLYTCIQTVNTYTCPNCYGIINSKKICYQTPTNQFCINLVKKYLPCKHQRAIPCNVSPNDYQCEELVMKLLKCGHQLMMNCFEKIENQSCLQKVIAKLPCGHLIEKYCYEKVEDLPICNLETIAECPKCFHKDTNICNQKLTCKNIVKKTLICGHQIDCLCSENVYAIQEQMQCNEIIQVRLQCGHSQQIKCFQKNLNNINCTKQCSKLRKCGHPCDRQCIDNCEEFPCTFNETFTLKCSHQVQLVCNELTQGGLQTKCNQYVFKKRKCGHSYPIVCQNSNLPEKEEVCESEVTFVLVCSHNLTLKCYQYLNSDQQLKCSQQQCLQNNPQQKEEKGFFENAFNYFKK